MQLTVTGKNIHIGEALREHTEKTIFSVMEKFFSNPVEATVIISKESLHFRADVSVHIGRGIVIRGHGVNDNPYSCVDMTIEKLGKRLRRHKNRLRDHHKVDAMKGDEFLTIKQRVLSPDDQEVGGGDSPVVVAEVDTAISTLSVSEAILHMDLGEQSFFLFKNSGSGEINLLYKRPDGNIGWIDPSLSR